MSGPNGYTIIARTLQKRITYTQDDVPPGSFPAATNWFPASSAGAGSILIPAHSRGTSTFTELGGTSPAIAMPFVQTVTWGAPPTVRAAPPRGPLGQGGGY